METKSAIDVGAQKAHSRRRWKFFRRFTITGQDGSPYLVRYTIVQAPWFAILLHHFLRSDADTCLHDHPWNFCSIILSGGYLEQTPEGTRFYGPGSVLLRPAAWRHRVLLYTWRRRPVRPWTLVLRSGYRRPWGFWTPAGWRHWEEFLRRKNRGEAQC